MKTQVVQIIIHRDLTSAPVDVVFAHEVPILRVIRGHGGVTVTDADCSGFELQPVNVRPRDELIRLKRKYRGSIVEGQHPVDVAYPDGSRDLELFYDSPETFENVGLEVDDEDFNEVVDQGPEEPAATSDAADESAETTSQISEILKAPAEAAVVDGAEKTPNTEAENDPNIDPVTGINLKDRPAVVRRLNELTIPFAKTTPTQHLATLLRNSVEAGATD